jgi:YggT family protein
VRKVIPPLGMIDLSPIVVFIAISLIDGIVVGSLTRAAGVAGALVGL